MSVQPDPTHDKLIARLSGDIIDVDNPLLLALIPSADHPTGSAGANSIRLHRMHRLGVGDLNLTHPQETQALLVQASGRKATPGL
ncbi:hypothetical protein MMC08_001285 [Hypocenomyce scalaris]|nr:hypothetical protein [Hypocenomyce scalaris]